MTLTPAYGRDYPSKKAVLAAWAAGKDFLIADLLDPACGKPINITDAKQAGITTVNIRYKKLTQICVVKVA